MTAGDQLRQARINAGLTIDQIARQTKVQHWILQAIERDDVSRVPGGIFLRGYLTSFASSVGLNPREILTAHFGELPPAPEPPPLPEPRVAVRETPRWQIVITAAAVLALAVTWRNMSRSNSDADALHFDLPPVAAAPAPPPPAPLGSPRVSVAALVAPVATAATTASATSQESAAAAPSAAAPVLLAVATPSQASTSPSLSAVVTTPPQGPTPGATATSGAASTSAAGSPADGRDTVPPAVDTATATVSAASAAPLTLQIRATGDVWIDASADSERKAYRLYTAGDEIRVEAQQQIHLVVGDAANVTLSINGMPAKPLGGAGIVRDLTISADSYRSLLP